MASEIRSTLATVGWIAALTAIASAGVIVASLMQKSDSADVARRLLGVWFAATLAGVAFLTLTPTGAAGFRPGSNLNPLAPVDLRNTVGNVALYVPLGFAAGLVWRTARWPILTAALCCVVVSFAIETAQWVFALGRSADVQDSLFDTVGGLLGASIATAIVVTIHAVRDP